MVLSGFIVGGCGGIPGGPGNSQLLTLEPLKSQRQKTRRQGRSKRGAKTEPGLPGETLKSPSEKPAGRDDLEDEQVRTFDLFSSNFKGCGWLWVAVAGCGLSKKVQKFRASSREVGRKPRQSTLQLMRPACAFAIPGTCCQTSITTCI
jgi:hypothetical protein